MSKRPEALRLADELGAEIERTVQMDMLHHNAAAELRRLHARVDADTTLLRQALTTLEHVTHHFTRTPSTLADTKARGEAHKAMDALRARLEAPC